MKKIIFAIMMLLTISCQKNKYPYQVLNIKATDCVYSVNNNVVNFTYVANFPENETYKRKVFTGYCNTRNVKEWQESYLWIDTATIVSNGFIYVE